MAYSDKQKTNLLNAICKRISEGEALRNILKDKSMPDSNTFYKWIKEDEDKNEQYARACEERQDLIFEEMFDIADDGTNDWMEKKKQGEVIGWELNGEHVQRSKVRIDMRKWALSKMNPKKYGDKLQTDVTSKGERITLSPEEREAEIERLIKKAQKK